MSAVLTGLQQLPCFQAPQGGGSGVPALDPCTGVWAALEAYREGSSVLAV